MKRITFIGTYAGRLPSLRKVLMFQASHCRGAVNADAAKVVDDELEAQRRYYKITIEEV